MSVSNQITRLSQAKAAIKAAIKAKGVDVPDATLLDGMADAIKSIPSKDNIAHADIPPLCKGGGAGGGGKGQGGSEG